MEKALKEAEELRLKDERAERFATQKAQLLKNVATFQRMTLAVKDDLKDVSGAHRRREWEKVESEYSSLRGNLNEFVGIDPSLDATEVTNAFEKDAQKVFTDTQKEVLLALKDEPLTRGGASDSSRRLLLAR